MRHSRLAAMYRRASYLTLVLMLIVVVFTAYVVGIMIRPNQRERLAGSYDTQPTVTGHYRDESTAIPLSTFDSVTSVAVVVATSTPQLTQIPTQTPYTPTVTPSISTQPVQQAVSLDGIQHVWQTWNNCGPATLTMNLSYFGHVLDQTEVGAALRRHEDDKNVGPTELAAFAHSQGFQAEVRVNGSTDLLRTLLSNGVPVLIETWHEDETGDGLGHYRLVTGYDDAAGQWIAYDTYDATDLIYSEGQYAGLRIPYGELDRLWRYFNRTYILIYPADQTELLEQLMIESDIEDAMWENALATATAETNAYPEDPIAWFNLGSSANALGDSQQAAAGFDQARELGLPWRMLWYQFGAFEAYAAEARYADLLTLADQTLAGTTSIEELHYWRGIALAGLGQADAARDAWQQAKALNPSFKPASDALTEVSP